VYIKALAALQDCKILTVACLNTQKNIKQSTEERYFKEPTKTFYVIDQYIGVCVTCNWMLGIAASPEGRSSRATRCNVSSELNLRHKSQAALAL